MMREESTTPREGVLVAVDLRDAEAWTRAGRELRAWGREHSIVHVFDNDHIAIEFQPGGALEASA
jgi:hypothetical protein